MELKEIKLRKGMAKQQVNELIEEFILLEDESYISYNYKHNWKCSCGNIIEGRVWDTIRYNNSILCEECLKVKSENIYKDLVEKDGEYEYIRSFRKGDILPTGKVINKSPYMQIKHKYCDSIYIIETGSFVNKGTRCTKCCHTYENSFAHHIEVELGLNINDVWDFEKNTVNPYHIHKNFNKHKIWIKCQNEEVNETNGLIKKDYHGSYEASCSGFYRGNRCSYCNPKLNNSHLYDSFGYKHFDKVCMNWHTDNKVSPFKISCGTQKKHKFICDECGNEWSSSIHNISNGTWCPKCSKSKGEKYIEEYLLKNNFTYEYDKEYFKDLRGLKNGILRPDFILPNEKIWIEYDGEFHYKNMVGIDNYNLIKEHDRRKDEYAKLNGWNLIRIPYRDFNNIEIILKQQLKL